jgi:hypothetical protein
MKVIREYTCDHGHRWKIDADESKPELPQDGICPDGHEAVTCQTLVPVDHVQLTIRSAAILTDRVTNRIELTGFYLLSISDRDGKTLRTSENHYKFRDVVALAERFTNRTAAEACVYWDHIKP